MKTKKKWGDCKYTTAPSLKQITIIQIKDDYQRYQTYLLVY